METSCLTTRTGRPLYTPDSEVQGNKTGPVVVVVNPHSVESVPSHLPQSHHREEPEWFNYHQSGLSTDLPFSSVTLRVLSLALKRGREGGHEEYVERAPPIHPGRGKECDGEGPFGKGRKGCSVEGVRSGRCEKVVYVLAASPRRRGGDGSSVRESPESRSSGPSTRKKRRGAGSSVVHG